MINDQAKAKLAYVTVCILWGSTYLAIRMGVSDFPPALFAGFRFLVAGLLVIIFSKVKGYTFPRANEYGRIAVVGLLLLLGGNGLVVFASQWVHSSMSALMIATVPLFMALLEAISPKNRTLSLRGWIGLFVGFGGVVLLVFSNSGTGAIDLRGAFLLLLAALSWAAGSIYSKSFHATGSLITQIGLQMLSGGIAFCVLGIALGEVSQVFLSAKGVGTLLYLIIFGSIVAYSSYIYILQKWPAAKVGTYAYINPVVAIMLGALVLGESVSFSIVLSAVIILGSVYIVQTSKIVENRFQVLVEIKKA